MAGSTPAFRTRSRTPPGGHSGNGVANSSKTSGPGIPLARRTTRTAKLPDKTWGFGIVFRIRHRIKELDEVVTFLYAAIHPTTRARAQAMKLPFRLASAVFAPPGERRKQFFFEKKAAPALREPKNSCFWNFLSLLLCQIGGETEGSKVFCFFFSKKKTLPLSGPPAAYPRIAADQ
jgi:hypothetical protein